MTLTKALGEDLYSASLALGQQCHSLPNLKEGRTFAH